MKLITTLTLTIILLFVGMIYGQKPKQDSTIHFITPKITEQRDTISPPMQNVLVSDADVTAPPQVPLPDSLKVFDYVEKMPEYPGGQKAMMEFIQKNLQYPEFAKDNNLQGTVFATFIIDKKGKITDVRILRSMNPPCIACDSEIIRVIKKMPKWKQGMQQGKPVMVRFNLPVKFALQ